MQDVNEKKIWKKMIAGILAMALVIGLLPSNMQQVEAAYTETTLTVGTVAAQEANKRYLIYLDASDVVETNLDVNALWPNNTVYIDGKAVSSSNSVADVNYAVDSELLLLTLDYSVFGATTAANVGKHTLIIPAGTIIGGTIKTTNDVGVIINNDSIQAADVITFTEVNYTPQDGSTRYLFTFGVTGTTLTDRFWNNNTVYVDGEVVSTDANAEQSVHYTLANESQLYFLLDYNSIETGKTTADSLERTHTLTISGGTAIGDCILKNTLNYTLDKSTITPAEPTADVTVIPTEPHSSGTYGFQFKVENPTDELAYDGQWTINYYFASGGVSYQSSGETEAKELPHVFLKKIGANTYYLAFDHYVVSENMTYAKGDKVTINGLVQNIGYGVQFAETTFEYDGSAWVLYEETEPTLTFTKTDGGAWQPSETDGDRWLTYLTSTETVLAEGTFIQSGINIVVSDGETETSYTLNAGDLLVVGGKWALLLWKNSYPAVPTQDETSGKAYIVTIKAGTASVSDGSTVTIPEDVSILYADGSVRGVIVGESKIVATNSGSTGGVYFGTETDNGWAYDGTAWSTRPYIEYGTITLDGTVLTPTLNSLVKYGANSYYFSLNSAETSNIPSTLKVGSVIIFDFYASETNGGGDGKVVYFPKTALQLTDSGWVLCKTLGDSNGDWELNVCDIVRYKKYLNDTNTEIDTVGADANESGKIDKRDIATLIEYLFEGVYFTKDGENSQAVTGIPYYADDIDISLGAYHGPRAANHMDYTYESLSNNGVGSGVLNTTSYLNETEFKRYADAGLNTLIHEADAVYASAAAKIGAGVSSTDFQTYMELAYEQGLDVYVTSQGLNSYLKPEGYGNTPVGADFNEDGNLYDDNGEADTAIIDETQWGWDYNGNGQLETAATLSEIFYYTDAITDGNGKTILEADIEELLDFVVEKGYDNFKGFVMADEVYDGMSDNYAKAVELIKAEGKERGLTLSVIGSQYPSSATGSKNSSGNYYIPSGEYESYIQKFGNAAGNFIFDRYPLLKNIAKGESNFTYSLDTGWLTNLETVAEQGKAGGFSTGVTLQSYGGEWWSTTNQWYGPNLRRDPISDADIQFQVYTALAYGMKSINYFTYWEHPIQTKEYYTSCMVEYGENGGVETDVYYYVKHANEEIKKFDHVFLDYDWQETLSASDSKDTKGCVSSWSQTTDVLLSRMYDKKKQLDGFWLVNASDPMNQTEKTVDVTFTDATKAIVFVDGEKKIVSLTNGKYETTLAAGEGQFVILVK